MCMKSLYKFSNTVEVFVIIFPSSCFCLVCYFSLEKYSPFLSPTNNWSINALPVSIFSQMELLCFLSFHYFVLFCIGCVACPSLLLEMFIHVCFLY